MLVTKQISQLALIFLAMHHIVKRDARSLRTAKFGNLFLTWNKIKFWKTYQELFNTNKRKQTLKPSSVCATSWTTKTLNNNPTSSLLNCHNKAAMPSSTPCSSVVLHLLAREMCLLSKNKLQLQLVRGSNCNIHEINDTIYRRKRTMGHWGGTCHHPRAHKSCCRTTNLLTPSLLCALYFLLSDLNMCIIEFYRLYLNLPATQKPLKGSEVYVLHKYVLIHWPVTHRFIKRGYGTENTMKENLHQNHPGISD